MQSNSFPIICIIHLIVLLMDLELDLKAIFKHSKAAHALSSIQCCKGKITFNKISVEKYEKGLKDVREREVLVCGGATNEICLILCCSWTGLLCKERA
jgi:hypothetical protein